MLMTQTDLKDAVCLLSQQLSLLLGAEAHPEIPELLHFILDPE
jgi:hypothetical protein